MKEFPHNVFNVQLTRSQLELLSKMLDQEIATLESGYAHPHPQILKKTARVIWEQLQPSPAEKQKRFASWVNNLGLASC